MADRTRDTKPVKVQVRGTTAAAINPWRSYCRDCRIADYATTEDRARELAQRHIDREHDGNGEVIPAPESSDGHDEN